MWKVLNYLNRLKSDVKVVVDPLPRNRLYPWVASPGSAILPCRDAAATLGLLEN